MYFRFMTRRRNSDSIGSGMGVGFNIVAYTQTDPPGVSTGPGRSLMSTVVLLPCYRKYCPVVSSRLNVIYETRLPVKSVGPTSLRQISTNKAVRPQTPPPVLTPASYFTHTSFSCRYIRRDMCEHDVINIQPAHCGLVGLVCNK